MKTKFILFALVFLWFQNYIHAQNPTQTIRGKVIDKDSKGPLPGAGVQLLNQPIPTGAAADANGQFSIKAVPVGRHSISISFLGYKEVFLNDVQVSSGKELLLTIEMEENIIETNAATVVAEMQLDKPLNEMATVSARTFTIEEAGRYAGSWGDPSRMVANFAGITGGNDQRNDIVVRGNSPVGVLWRLEGMDIPSPNHFSTNGSSGGGISILNNNTLSNSDFMTGAFPAEYSNALSGVFDLKLRKGNDARREHTIQFGATGFELGAEGPFKKGKRASYLIAYRYSALGLLDKFGFLKFIGSVPFYQDFTVNLNFPYKNGNFSFFAIGGKSHLTFEPSKDTTLWDEDPYLMRKRKPISTMGVAGTTWMHFLNSKTYIKTGLIAAGSQTIYVEDSSDYNYHYTRIFNTDFSEITYTGQTVLNSKISARSSFRAGISYSYISFDFLTERNYFVPLKYTRTLIDFGGNSGLAKGFIQWKYKPTEKLSLNGGMSYLHYFLNQRNSPEPRVGLKYEISNRHSISVAAGMHSKLLPAGVYFGNIEEKNGSFTKANQNLDFFRTTHYVLSYDWNPFALFRVKAEVYFQELYAAPVHKDSSSFFSGLNLGADYENIVATRAFESTGTGRNYGAELTLEKFLSHGFYFLMTGSLFESLYKGSDGIERNTTFNVNYAGNVLGGKEFKVGKNKQNVISLNSTLALIGGRREVPVLRDSSIKAGYGIYDYDRAFEKRVPDYVRFDGRIGYRMNRKKYANEIALDIRNILNRKNVFLSYYDPAKAEVVYAYQVGFFPVLFYKIEF